MTTTCSTLKKTIRLSNRWGPLQRERLNINSTSNVQVCILDYGAGNVASVFNAFNLLDCSVKISNSHKDIESASHLVLPGVGAFGPSMQKIVERIPVPLLKEQISKSKPVLGICVGMQVFSSLGYEHGETVGLDLIEGDVRLLPDHGLPIPHIGWNSMNIASESPLFRNLPNNPDFYFLHSYFFQPKNNLNVLATTDYGLAFPSVVGINNLFGVQFHPEKSQKNGRLLLKNFLEIV